MSRTHVMARLALLSAGLASCDRPTSNPSQSATTSRPESLEAAKTLNCEQGFEAFSKTLYPLLRSRCAHCHDINSPEGSDAPKYVVADPRVPYHFIANMVNFQNIRTSKIVKRAGNGHCKDYSEQGYDCAVTTDDAAAAVQNWWDEGEKFCAAGFQFKTNAIPVPETMPEFPSQNFTTLRFSLAHLGAQFAGVQFEVGVQRFQKPTSEVEGAYRFLFPRILSSEKTIAIEGIQIVVNDLVDGSASQWASIKQTVNADQLPETGLHSFATLSPKPIIVLQRNTIDNISFIFDSLKVVDTQLACRELAAFESDVKPVLAAKCGSCHTGVHPTVTKRLSFSGSSADVCAAVLQRSSFPFRQSTLVQFAAARINNHDLTLDAVSIDRMQKWADKEIQ